MGKVYHLPQLLKGDPVLVEEPVLHQGQQPGIGVIQQALHPDIHCRGLGQVLDPGDGVLLDLVGKVIDKVELMIPGEKELENVRMVPEEFQGPVNIRQKDLIAVGIEGGVQILVDLQDLVDPLIFHREQQVLFVVIVGIEGVLADIDVPADQINGDVPVRCGPEQLHKTVADHPFRAYEALVPAFV